MAQHEITGSHVLEGGVGVGGGKQCLTKSCHSTYSDPGILELFNALFIFFTSSLPHTRYLVIPDSPGLPKVVLYRTCPSSLGTYSSPLLSPSQPPPPPPKHWQCSSSLAAAFQGLVPTGKQMPTNTRVIWYH